MKDFWHAIDSKKEHCNQRKACMVDFHEKACTNILKCGLAMIANVLVVDKKQAFVSKNMMNIKSTCRIFWTTRNSHHVCPHEVKRNQEKGLSDDHSSWKRDLACQVTIFLEIWSHLSCKFFFDNNFYNCFHVCKDHRSKKAHDDHSMWKRHLACQVTIFLEFWSCFGCEVFFDNNDFYDCFHVCRSQIKKSP